MKKLYFLLLFFTTMIQAQIVNIPDQAFKNALTNGLCVDDNLDGSLDRNVDTNHNGEIELWEAQSVTGLYLPDAYITSMIGISAFTNLKILYCYSNLLTSLDVSALTQLEYLECEHNDITNLNISGLTALKTLICVDTDITSLDLTSFPNLEYLDCTATQLSSLNVSGLLHLKYLRGNSNPLTNLDLSGLVALENVEVSYGHLTSLNLTGLVNLKKLYCEQNQLEHLNLNGLNALEMLKCFDNLFTTIDLSGLSNLEFIECHSPYLTSLDLSGLQSLKRVFIGWSTNLTSLNVSNLPNLESLDCMVAQVTTLDLSDSHHLTYLNCSHMNLETLFIKNGSDEYVDITDSILLNYVCADESQIAAIQEFVDTDTIFHYYNGDLVINSYCSVAPGGDFNTIVGTLKFDANGNGCDANDIALHNLKVTIDDGMTQGTSFANGNGQYTLYAQVGSFVVTPVIENPTWFSFAPPTATIPFADNNNNTATQDFCVTPNGFHPDIEVIIAPLTSARPGFDARYKITYKNKGNYAYAEGIVGLQFYDNVLDFISASQTPMTQSFGQLNWNFTNLMPFESRSIEVTFNVNGPMEIPAVNNGDSLNYVVSSFPSEVDEIPQDNTFAYHQTVVGSFDPNDKTCLEGNVIAPEMIGNYLHYNINFENTGNAPAENIVVKDIIDTTKFDISTLQILDAPNASIIKITGNKVEVIFDHINLEPAAHGHVLFKIKTKGDLAVGSTVSNKAEIYFDYNFPVETNTATSTFQLLSNATFETDNSITVYPNPTKNQVSVSADNIIKSIQFFDVQGRIMNTILPNDTKANLDIATYSRGIYFLKVSTDKGIKTQKIIKE
ncbi:T9SS type A sorting domain-containing protein [Flavobacterium sp.]|uniref:DUF7619 domain-containing protein n=1 Tax=Flavobacterium sp. TaxID=239 RepID=UPI00286CC071|nr:T9SS type A sorting domain-containing protein [Flavobacterium sp.]